MSSYFQTMLRNYVYTRVYKKLLKVGVLSSYIAWQNYICMEWSWTPSATSSPMSSSKLNTLQCVNILSCVEKPNWTGILHNRPHNTFICSRFNCTSIVMYCIIITGQAALLMCPGDWIIPITQLHSYVYNYYIINII